MKRYFIFIVYCQIILNVQAGNKINYISPSPGSKMINVENNVIIGFEQSVNFSQNDILAGIKIQNENGEFSRGTIISVSEGRKIVFKPAAPFTAGDKITVTLSGKFSNYIKGTKGNYSFSFFTSPVKIPVDPVKIFKSETGEMYKENLNQSPYSEPYFNITVNKNPSPGCFFLTPYASSTYISIYSNQGLLIWSESRTGLCGDLKTQPNGNITYYIENGLKFIELNSNYENVNSYQCGNGYTTDIHELRVLNNRHAYLMAYDHQIVDMSAIVTGGYTNAIVTGLVIQEIDENKNVVFQWRSWDHFLITDATHENLLGYLIDYVHGNAIEIDNDSNLIISSRHMDEITKINHITGAIIWRLGGKNNQFTFNNDPIKFSYQHAIRRIANGNLTLFDNGNYHTPQFSRAVEYSIDEVNKTVTKVWEFRNTPSIYASWGGYVQRLEGGNTLIGWGGARPSVTEVTPAGVVEFEATFPVGVFSYRAFKYPWNEVLPVSHESGSTPKAFSLGQNYPNPFNPSTIISFSVGIPSGQLPVNGFITIKIFDILGREVQTLINEQLKAGSYEVDFDGSKFASGIYYYSLSAGNYSETKKMALVK